MFRATIWSMATTSIPFTETEPYQDHDGAACQRFAAAFLVRNIREDALSGSKQTQDARKGLAGCDCAFPFGAVCDFLDVDERRMREQIQKLIEPADAPVVEYAVCGAVATREGAPVNRSPLGPGPLGLLLPAALVDHEANQFRYRHAQAVQVWEQSGCGQVHNAQPREALRLECGRYD